jgi:hypothetical protein
MVTWAQPPAVAGVLSLGGFLPLVPVSVVLANGYRRVVVTGAQGPVVRVLVPHQAT